MFPNIMSMQIITDFRGPLKVCVNNAFRKLYFTFSGDVLCGNKLFKTYYY